MEKYIYYSIVFFSIIIIFLYIYIIFQKLIENRREKKKALYSKEVVPLIESIINRIIDGKIITQEEINKLEEIFRKEENREIVTEASIYYFENFTGGFITEIIKLFEVVGIIDFEIKKLKSKNLYRKALACKRLGEFRSNKAIPYLLEELNVRYADVSYNVFLALAKIGNEEAFIKAFSESDNIMLSERSLIEIVDSFEGDKINIYKTMINSNNSYVASIFIKSAGNFKDYSLAEEISSFLQDDNKEKRIAAIKSIGQIGDTRYIDKITSLLKDKDWEVRAVAARALGMFGEKDVVNFLITALSDPQWFVRYNAANSILDVDNSFYYLIDIFQGEDKFAKDIMLSSIENRGKMELINSFKYSELPERKKVYQLIHAYITEKNEDELS